MNALMKHQRFFWATSLLLLCLSLGLGVWQYFLQEALSGVQQHMCVLQQEVSHGHAQASFRSVKEPLLKEITQRAFVCSKAPSYHSLKERLIEIARKNHLEKVRFESSPSTRAQGLHMRPVTFFLQAPLDMDVYGFMQDVARHAPGVSAWTFFSLFSVPGGGVQGELRGEFYTYEK